MTLTYRTALFVIMESTINGIISCFKYEMNLGIFRVVVSMAMFPAVSAADGCYYKPCQKYGNQSKQCQFSIACNLERPFAKCQVSSLYLDRPVLKQEQSGCIDPGLVPGFKDFCSDLLYNTSLAFPGPANTNNDDVTNFPTEDVVYESKMHLESTCFDTTVLASVAVGCFLAGGFVMLVLLACCRTSFCTCLGKKDEVVADAGNEHSNWYPQARGREIGSTSSAQLLTNASMDSMGTHNTLLSNSESHVSNEVTASGPSASSHFRDSFGTWTGPGRSRFGPPQFPSPPWTSRSRSAQWTDPRSMSLSQTHTPVSHWNTEHMSLPRTHSETARWIPQGQPHVVTEQSQSAPWLDTIYSPESESSSRDYQSIHGGSENPYAPCSESSSDYSAPQTHRAMLIHDGEIYQPSSESSGSNNDYTSLKGQRFSRTNDGIYYPTSEGSYKDYASLAGEKDNVMNACAGFNSDTTNANIQTNGDGPGSNVKFNVKGLNFPYQSSCKSNRGWVSNLQEINEYESVDAAAKGADKEVDISNVRTLADMIDINHNSETSAQPHEYYTLEPLQKKDS